jgi:hypothetical protein
MHRRQAKTWPNPVFGLGSGQPWRASQRRRSSPRGQMQKISAGRVDEEVAHPHPSQIRMCRFPASGSSWESLARGGADDTIRDLPAKNDSREDVRPPGWEHLP